MAVLKSTAYGQVRKSVGANNYYRRAGVQIVRSKPVFAPGRVFTPSQLNQQARMKAVYFLRDEWGVFECADYCNTLNNKLYNASSRYNRLMSKLMKGMSKWNPEDYSDANEWALFNLYILTYDFSTGNLINPVNSMAASPASSSTPRTLDVNLFCDTTLLGKMLEQVNKKRPSSSILTAANIGMCGFHGALMADETYNVLPPSMPTSVDAPSENNPQTILNYTFNLPDDFQVEVKSSFNIALFAVDLYDRTTHKPKTKAIYSTSTIRVKYVAI